MLSIFYNYYKALIIFPLFLLFIVSNNNDYKKPATFEYKGAVLTHIHDIRSGYGSEISQNMHKHLKKVGYNTVQLNTFAYMKDIKEPVIYYGYDPSLKPKYIENEIKNLHNSGFMVMLKPHVWIGGNNLDPNNWRNKIDYADDALVKAWFQSYKKFIIYQARIAEKSGVEIFVIGTELVGMSKYDKHWNKLIEDVREIYSGKITYAAEGLNAENITFWTGLDYIGIDAYFKLTEKDKPELKQILNGWKRYEKELSELYAKYNKKIIFTEIGYKSVEGTTIRPWEWNDDKDASQLQQAVAFEAFFKAHSNAEYLEGFFIWKYFTDNGSYERGNIPKGFTPYNKMAEGVISDWIVN
ncbi:MAG: glycoside hydrolase family 113 [Thermodesulfobacteriota bacterium]